MKKTVLVIICAAMALALIYIVWRVLPASCAGKGNEDEHEVINTPTEELSDTEIPEISDTETPEPTSTPEPIEIKLRERFGFVKANSNGTYGIANDGSIRFTGKSTSGQHMIRDWKDIVDAELNESTTAALTGDGEILLTGKLEGRFSESSSWKDIVDIAMGAEHLVGLKSDGTLVACGDGSKGQCEVNDWSGALKVVAAGDYTAALTNTGVITTLGDEFDSILNEGRVADIDAAEDHIVLLLSDGSVVSVGIDAGHEVTRFDWSDAVAVFAAKAATYAVDSAGKLMTDSKIIDEELENVCCVAASEKHAVVLLGNGKCVGFGDDSSLQTEVSGWRLLPYVTSGGWLIGCVPGTDMDGSKVCTGLKTVYKNPATGEEKEAVCVLIGDVNGDGSIDSLDVTAVRSHIKGSIKLTGAELRAANVVPDSSKPGAVDKIDLEALEKAVNRGGVPDQYAKTDFYTDKLADAKRINSDTLGYITIKGTNISYPILYDYNWFYNDHNINRQPEVRGSIYFYRPEESGNTVITGHNSRTSKTMFHQLHTIQNNAKKLSEYKNRVWTINTYGETGRWEVWAMYEEGAFKNESMSSQVFNTCLNKAYNDMSADEKQAWIDYQKKKNALKYSVDVSIDDRFVTLVTCGDSHADAQYGARLYFFLRWIGND